MFGWTHGSAAFQMMSDTIAFMMQDLGCKVHAYIDDYVVVAPRNKADEFFHALVSLLQELGLPMNPGKKTPPSEVITCLGIQIDIPKATISIDPEKLRAIYLECFGTQHKKYITKKGLQSLIGKLIYIHKCVAPARIFINRILGLLRESTNRNRIKLTKEFFADLQWFVKFLPHFNGVTIFKRTVIPSQETLFLDACLTGMGGIWSNRVYSYPVFTIPGVKLHINHLEMLNIVVALRLWGHWWANASVSIRCDNLAVVQVVNTHKTKDAILAACVRNIWLICALYNISLSVVHIKGNLNVKADLLSRLYSDKPVDQRLLKQLQIECIWDTVKSTHLKLDLSFYFQMLRSLPHISFKEPGPEFKMHTDLPPLLHTLLISGHLLHYCCFYNYLYKSLSTTF